MVSVENWLIPHHRQHVGKTGTLGLSRFLVGRILRSLPGAMILIAGTTESNLPKAGDR